MTERAVLKSILQLGVGDVRLFRNNVGVLIDARGVPVRYGLCNGSSDVIGWRSIVVTPEHVGGRLAVFVAIEAKYGANKETAEQTRFLSAVRRAGGLTGIALSQNDARLILAGMMPNPGPSP